jgi:hypothetical protein
MHPDHGLDVQPGGLLGLIPNITITPTVRSTIRAHDSSRIGCMIGPLDFRAAPIAGKGDWNLVRHDIPSKAKGRAAEDVAIRAAHFSLTVEKLRMHKRVLGDGSGARLPSLKRFDRDRRMNDRDATRGRQTMGLKP